MPALQITPIPPAGLGRSPDALSVAGVMARGITAISPDTRFTRRLASSARRGSPAFRSSTRRVAWSACWASTI